MSIAADDAKVLSGTEQLCQKLLLDNCRRQSQQAEGQMPQFTKVVMTQNVL